jgi:hypothetical protein
MGDYTSLAIGGTVGLLAFIAALINVEREKRAKAKRAQSAGDASAKA